MSDELTTIAAFETPLEAELARLRLESHEIPCFIIGGQVGGLQIFGLSLEAVRIQVPAVLAERAAAVLAVPEDEADAEITGDAGTVDRLVLENDEEEI